MSENKEIFDFNVLSELSLKNQKEYIKRFFIPLNNGDNVVVGNEIIIMNEEKIKKSYFNRMPKPLSKWYFTEYTEVKNPVCELGKPFLYDNNVNLCPQFKYKRKPYKDVNPEIKEKLNILLSYMKEILSDNNESSYQFLIKWLANMLQGNKNQSCLYLKGEQGIGKSTLFEFLREYVIGDDLFLETGSGPLKKDFNSILVGKLLVFFEELECFTSGEWSAISSKLKRQITSKVINIEGKNQNAYQTRNINNYAIGSNFDAVKDAEGRRFFILDINNKRKGNKPYWKNIYDNCFNKKVGRAFFYYMLEIDVSSFDSQDFPQTKNKLDTFAKRLDNIELFVKTKYVLRKKAIKCDVEQLFIKYNDFCMTQNHKPLGKYAFCNRLKELGIHHFKSNDRNRYNVSYEELSKIADSRFWIHELDEYETKDEDEFLGVGLDDTTPGEHALREENKALKDEISKLKFELEQLKIKNLKKDLAEVKETSKEFKIKIEEAKKTSEEAKNKDEEAKYASQDRMDRACSSGNTRIYKPKPKTQPEPDFILPDPNGLDYYEDDILNQLDNAEEVEYPEEYEFNTRKDKTQREAIEKMKNKLNEIS